MIFFCTVCKEDYLQNPDRYVYIDFCFSSYSSLNQIVLQDMKKFEIELRGLQAALEQAQATLTSPELGHLSLKEQLSHRQVRQDQDIKVNI